LLTTPAGVFELQSCLDQLFCSTRAECPGPTRFGMHCFFSSANCLTPADGVLFCYPLFGTSERVLQINHPFFHMKITVSFRSPSPPCLDFFSLNDDLVYVSAFGYDLNFTFVVHRIDNCLSLLASLSLHPLFPPYARTGRRSPSFFLSAFFRLACFPHNERTVVRVMRFPHFSTSLSEW